MNLNVNNKLGPTADQTPTPTRFIRNCEEVGLFQDLQNVNPFEETFRKAVEAGKQGLTISQVKESNAALSDDTLHTPNVFPLINEPQTDHSTSTRNTDNRFEPAKTDVRVLPKKLRKYKRKTNTTVNVLCDPHFVAVDSNVTFKLPIPKIPPSIKVFSPHYFAVMSKHVSKFSSECTPSQGEEAQKLSEEKKETSGPKKCTRSRTEVRESNRLSQIRTREKRKHYMAYLEKLNKELADKNFLLERKVSALMSANAILEQKLELAERSQTSLIKFPTVNVSVQTGQKTAAVEASELPDTDVNVKTCVSSMHRNHETNMQLVSDDHNYVGSTADAYKDKRECFYASIPKKNVPLSSDGFLRKPFKKRNVNRKLCVKNHKICDDNFNSEK